MKYTRILNAICDVPWAIHPAKLEAILGVLEARAAGILLSGEELAAIDARRKKYAGVNGSVAVLPLMGTIAQRFGAMQASGGTSTDEFGKMFDEALNNAEVGAVLMDVDTHGGSSLGLRELGDKIFAARGKKPIVAVVNSECYSAGVWLGTAADEVVITPGGYMGSVGVVSVHLDYSKFNEEAGIKPTYITAGKYKVEGNYDEPLGDEARAEIQRHVDACYADFLAAVARNRKTNVNDVRKNYGEGRIFRAQEAVAIGMADRIASFEQVLAELNAARKPVTKRFGAERARLALARKKGPAPRNASRK